MKDFFTVDTISIIVALIATIFSISSAYMAFKGLRKTQANGENEEHPLVFKVNGKKITVYGKDKDVLNKVLGLTGNELVFIERLNEKSLQE